MNRVRHLVGYHAGNVWAVLVGGLMFGLPMAWVKTQQAAGSVLSEIQLFGAVTICLASVAVGFGIALYFHWQNINH